MDVGLKPCSLTVRGRGGEGFPGWFHGLGGPLTFVWDGVSQIVKGEEDPTAISSHSLAPQPRPSPKASITHEV